MSLTQTTDILLCGTLGCVLGYLINAALNKIERMADKKKLDIERNADKEKLAKAEHQIKIEENRKRAQLVFRPGDVVQHVTGGPKIVIIAINPDFEYLCHWFDRNGQSHLDAFRSFEVQKVSDRSDGSDAATKTTED